MVMLGGMLDNLNIKEFLAIGAGLTAGDIVDGFITNYSQNQKLAIKTGGGLALTYFLNSYALEAGARVGLGISGETARLGALAATAMAVQEPQKRISISIAKKTGRAVVVGRGRQVQPIKVSRGIDRGKIVNTVTSGGTARGRR
jgi:hypothetical protein